MDGYVINGIEGGEALSRYTWQSLAEQNIKSLKVMKEDVSNITILKPLV